MGERVSSRPLPSRTRKQAERGLGQDLDALPPGTLAELERRLEAAPAVHLDGDEYRFVSHMRLALGARVPA